MSQILAVCVAPCWPTYIPRIPANPGEQIIMTFINDQENLYGRLHMWDGRGCVETQKLWHFHLVSACQYFFLFYQYLLNTIYFLYNWNIIVGFLGTTSGCQDECPTYLECEGNCVVDWYRGTDWSLLGKHGPTWWKWQAPAKDVCIFLQQAAAYIAQPEPDITRLGMSRQLFHFIYLPVIARYYSHSKKGGKNHFWHVVNN